MYAGEDAPYTYNIYIYLWNHIIIYSILKAQTQNKHINKQQDIQQMIRMLYVCNAICFVRRAVYAERDAYLQVI